MNFTFNHLCRECEISPDDLNRVKNIPIKDIGNIRKYCYCSNSAYFRLVYNPGVLIGKHITKSFQLLLFANDDILTVIYSGERFPRELNVKAFPDELYYKYNRIYWKCKDANREYNPDPIYKELCQIAEIETAFQY